MINKVDNKNKLLYRLIVARILHRGIHNFTYLCIKVFIDKVIFYKVLYFIINCILLIKGRIIPASFGVTLFIRDEISINR